MTSKTINIQDVDILVSDDGCVRKPHRVTGEVSTYGTDDGRGYKQVRVGGRKDGKLFRIHRLVAQAFLPNYREDLHVDHINGDKSDNRSSNLRMVSFEGNRCGYLQKSKGKTSQYRGVSWDKSNRGWLAQTKLKGKSYSLGTYESEEDAAKSYDVTVFALGFPAQALNFSVKDAASLLLFTLLAHKINTTKG